VSRVIAFTDGVVADEKVPLRQDMHTRSEVVVGIAEKKVPGGQVVLSFMQPVCVGVAKVDGDAEGEKVPAAHVVQVRSKVAAAAAE